MLVDNAATSAAIRDVFNETRSILEPAGAVGVAGARAYLRHYGIKVGDPCRRCTCRAVKLRSPRMHDLPCKSADSVLLPQNRLVG